MIMITFRYPSFTDALRDLDDGLCTIHLFAQLSADQKVSAKQINNARRLSLEFQRFFLFNFHYFFFIKLIST